ncbi:unnamed protein product, partial [Linum tenue]
MTKSVIIFTNCNVGGKCCPPPVHHLPVQSYKFHTCHRNQVQSPNHTLQYCGFHHPTLLS